MGGENPIGAAFHELACLSGCAMQVSSIRRSSAVGEDALSDARAIGYRSAPGEANEANRETYQERDAVIIKGKCARWAGLVAATIAVAALLPGRPPAQEKPLTRCAPPMCRSPPGCPPGSRSTRASSPSTASRHLDADPEPVALARHGRPPVRVRGLDADRPHQGGGERARRGGERGRGDRGQEQPDHPGDRAQGFGAIKTPRTSRARPSRPRRSAPSSTWRRSIG